MIHNEKRMEAVAYHIREILLLYGLDLKGANYIDTSKRVAKVYEELFEGLDDITEKVEEIFSKTFPSKYTGIVAKSGITIYTLCPHHLLPVELNVNVAYIPNGEVVGISKIIRVVKLLARKPSLQEDLTQEIADVIRSELDTKGVFVMLKGIHSCELIRGVQTKNTTATSAVLGLFEDDASAKAEALTLWGI